ncbi:MAG TPA: hypothetical protein VGX68_25375 [Thermoanaerobaculia bacterium]|jgi:hypothetical protein|nr:hypothetical protein [Thermoanaerobaculia bacterium]
MRARSLVFAAGTALLLTCPLQADEPEAGAWEPLFVGFGTEPEMDFGGRTVMSLDSLISRSFSRIGDVGERHPGVAPAWEFPVGAAVLLIQHEVGGHGGRAREFGLSPSYSFGYDLSAATGTERPPETNEGNALLAAGGVEADGVMANRTLLDLLRPEGADGAKVPLAMMAKLDLTLYVSTAKDPDDGEDFVDQYRDGNDIAYYLLSRQAQRRDADPASIWDGTYQADLGEPLLGNTWDDARVTALWNLLDPSLVGAMINYFREHVLGGSERVHAPVVRISDSLGLTLGTRGALGPQEVSRFLDLHAATRRGVFTIYVRDLDSSTDRTYGAGASVHALRLGRNLEIGLAADGWEEPDAREGIRSGSGWNATAELDAFFNERWGLAAKVGSKSDGFFPGLPLEDGPYFAFGVRAAL